MPAIARGSNNSFFQGNENGTVDRYGVAMMTAQHSYPFEEFATSLLPIGTMHPTLTGMEVTKASFRVIPGRKRLEVVYAYEGFIGSLPEPTYEFQGSFGREPIGAHPNIELIAGYPSAPLNGAIWVDYETREVTTNNVRGILQGFSFYPGTSRNLMAGVTEFEDPRGFWVEYSFSATKPTAEINNTNKIDNPPGSPPNFGGGRNWKAEPPTYQKRGGVYQIRSAWQLSGAGGWNTIIYG